MAGITLSELLKKMIEMQGSDLHLSTNSAPRVRVHGKLQAAGHAAADRGGYQGAGVQRADGRAEAPPRGKPGARLFVRLEEPGAVPRQHLSPARRGGRGLPHHSLGDQGLRRAGPSADRAHALRQAARPGAGDRADRIGEIHHARRHARQDQQRARRAHDHHRGPDRVPAQPQEVPGQPARSALRHAFLRQFAARRAARRPRRGADRRNARSGNHRIGAAHRRNRAT